MSLAFLTELGNSWRAEFILPWWLAQGVPVVITISFRLKSLTFPLLLPRWMFVPCPFPLYLWVFKPPLLNWVIKIQVSPQVGSQTASVVAFIGSLHGRGLWPTSSKEQPKPEHTFPSFHWDVASTTPFPLIYDALWDHSWCSEGLRALLFSLGSAATINSSQSFCCIHETYGIFLWNL